MIGPLTYLDIGLLAVAFLSGLLAMYRGLTREILSILSWVVAAGAVFYFIYFHEKFAMDLATQMPWTGLSPNMAHRIAQIGIGAVIFLIVLVVVHLITARMSDSVLDSRIGMIDRVLGFGFGVIRGFLIVLIVFMFYVHFYPDRDKQHAFVSQSKFYDLLLNSGTSLHGAMAGLAEKLQSKVSREQ